MMRIILLIFLMVQAIEVLPSDRFDRWIIVNNNTEYPVMRLYASNVDREHWEENILGGDLLLPGYYAEVEIDDGSGYCLYDLKVVFTDGEEIVELGVNVCELEEWRVW